MTVVLLTTEEAQGCALDLALLSSNGQAFTLAALHRAMREELLSRCPWRELPLSVRAANLLEHHGINTLASLLRYTPSRLRALPGCGRTSCEDIQRGLQTFGLSLRREEGEATT